MNPHVIAYTSAIAVLTGLIFGMAPALQAAKTNVYDALKNGGRGSAGGARNRLRNVLVVAEIALSLILLVGASLFVRSFLNLQDSRAGLDTAPLMTLRFYMPGDQYDAPDAIVRRVEDIVRRVEVLPGVVSVMASNMVPLSGGGSRSGVVPEGVPITAGQEPHVSNFRLFTVRDDKPSPYAFLSYPYEPTRNTGLTIRVAGGAPASISSAVRQEIRKSDPTLPLFNLQSGEEARVSTFWQFRLFGWMFSIFGVIALLLASIGVYGVLAYAVSQRTQEIGVRMALGARRQDIFTLIVSQGARLAGIGILCGVIGAAAVTRVITSQLYNVSATDPLSFIGTAAFLALVALLASYIPARRATSVDPMIALRAE